MAILTNKIDTVIDFDRLSSKYDVFSIETSDDYIKSGAFILDAAEIDNSVKAISFVSGKSFYVLMNQNEENFYKLKKLISDSDLSDKLTFKKVAFNTINNGLIVQLLLNALGSYDNKYLRANNLTGHFYVFNPKWSVSGKLKNEEIIKQVICLEIAVSDDGFISLPVRTFTNAKLKGVITFKKKKFDEYPRYVYAANNTLRRRLKDDSQETFILRQIDGKKSDIPFLDISDIDSFEASKAGMLQKILEIFNDKYQGIASISFEKEKANDELEYSNTEKKAEAEIVSDGLKGFSIKIVDEVGTEVSKCFCEDIKQLIIDTYDYGNHSIEVKIGKNINKSALNIVVIHNKQFYVEMNDIHDKSYNGIVQHVTLEDFSESSKYAIKTVVKEALIKRDLSYGKITIFPWETLGFDGDISFGTMVKDEDRTEKYYFMKIRPDGTFSFKEQELNLFEMTEYYDLVDIYESDNSVESICGIIKDEKGNINVIRDTGWFTLPEINLISKELKDGNNKLRGKAARDEFLHAVLDLKTFEKNGNLYYFSGVIGNGMKAKVENSANIRRLDKYKDSELVIDKLLPLMDTTLVRNGQLTVLPYPFKYLREYIQSL